MWGSSVGEAELTLYTDEAGNNQGAGYGFVAFEGNRLCHSEKGPLRRIYPYEAELYAIRAALNWLVSNPQRLKDNDFSTIFIVGRIIWYLIKVAMYCGYIHCAHGCLPQLAWWFCTKSHHYQKSQWRQQAAESGRSDNDPLGSLRKRRTIREHVMSLTSCSCLDPCQPLDFRR